MAAPLVKTASAVILMSTPKPAPSLSPWLSAATDELSTSKRPPRMRTVPPPLPLASIRAFCESSSLPGRATLSTWSSGPCPEVPGITSAAAATLAS
jgi:hypothetical protein